MEEELGSRGVVAEAPIPTYGYLQKDERYYRIRDEDLINDWVVDTLGELIHRSKGKEYRRPNLHMPYPNKENLRLPVPREIHKRNKTQRESMGTDGRTPN